MKILNRRKKVRYVDEPPIINGLNYIEKETKIGKWGDDDLYRSIISFKPDKVGYKTYPHNISNIKEIKKFFGFAHYISTTGQPVTKNLTEYDTASSEALVNYNKTCALHTVTGTSIQVIYGVDVTGNIDEIEVELYYTKTTD